MKRFIQFIKEDNETKLQTHIIKDANKDLFQYIKKVPYKDSKEEFGKIFVMVTKDINEILSDYDIQIDPDWQQKDKNYLMISNKKHSFELYPVSNNIPFSNVELFIDWENNIETTGGNFTLKDIYIKEA